MVCLGGCKEAGATQEFAAPCTLLRILSGELFIISGEKLRISVPGFSPLIKGIRYFGLFILVLFSWNASCKLGNKPYQFF